MDEKEHSIRFINSGYDTLFRIPDGGTVEIRFPDRTFTAKCEYLDDYHTKIGDTVSKGQELAIIVDPLRGSVLTELTAPCDGVVLYTARTPLVNEDTLAFQLVPTGVETIDDSEQRGNFLDPEAYRRVSQGPGRRLIPE